MYDPINGTLVGNNLIEIFMYSNDVTHNQFISFVLICFFLTVFVGSMMAQLKFTARFKPDTSFLASTFATLGLALILSQYPGLINPTHFIILVMMFIIGLIWVALDD